MLLKKLKKLKNKKAAGLNGIPPEVWKTGKFKDLLLYYCKEYTTEMEFNLGLKDVFCAFQRKVILVRRVIIEG